jgi:Cysteine rich repeat
MRIRSLASVMLVSALVAVACAQAQTPAPSPDVQAARAALHKACQSDMQTLCADKQGREAMQCLRSNTDKLSADCKDAMAKMPKRAPPPPQGQ